MANISLFRKYRSQSFSELIGQTHIVRSLQNALKSGRIAQAYLFTGPRGTGKTSTARLLAKALCCETGPSSEPCNACANCVSITEGSCFDVLELDAASESGVDEIRETIVQASEYLPSQCRYRIFIIDEVHDLSTKAFDALLKTIEEPPAHVVFILATTEYSKVPQTIRSRCQKYEFHRASLPNLIARLQHVSESEGIEIEPAALTAISRMADGGYRDAINLLEQAMLTSDGPITLDSVYDQLGLVTNDAVDAILFAIKDADVAGIVTNFAEVSRIGRDPRALLESMLYRLADLTRAIHGLDGSEGANPTANAGYHDVAVRLGSDTIVRFRGLLAEAHKAIRDVTIPRLWLESELIRISALPEHSAVVKAQPQVAAGSQPASAPKTNGSSAAAEPVQAVVQRSEAAEPKPPQIEHSQPAFQDDSEAGLVWRKVVEEVMSRPKAAVTGQKLARTRVASLVDGVLRIEFFGQIDLDTLFAKHGTDRRQMLVDLVHKHAPEPWSLEFGVQQRELEAPELPAVESPLVGESLSKVAQDVFGDKVVPS